MIALRSFQRPRLLAFLLLVLAAPLAFGQAKWERLPLLGADSNHAAVWDPVNERVLLVTAYANPVEVWEYDGEWRLASTGGPSQRVNFGLSFDAQRGVMTLFGGTPASSSSTLYDDTWEWDDGTWTERTPTIRPEARHACAMAYDSLRGVTVLYGGIVNASTNASTETTWEWNGTQWYRYTQPPRPNARWGAAMAFDSARGVMVLHGGNGAPFSATAPGETWEYDGALWTRRTYPAAPNNQAQHAMAYDAQRARTVLFGNKGTWEWDGTDWLERFPATSPGSPSQLAMAYDAKHGRTIAHGGLEFSVRSARTWSWDGADWTGEPVTSPAQNTSFPGVGYDEARDRVVVFGGREVFSAGHGTPVTILNNNDTYEWDGERWRLMEPLVRPGPRSRLAMTYDPVRERTVVFGGRNDVINGNYTDPHSDTWEYDGTTWTLVAAAGQGPSPRMDAAMEYDPATGTVLLFGGTDGNQVTNLGDTWSWDGVSWTLLSPATSPPARHAAAFARDVSTGDLVLFGGEVHSFGPYAVDDTWVWNGEWTEQVLGVKPAPVAFGSLVDDRWRDRLVFIAPFQANTWEWDGEGWQEAAPKLAPPSGWANLGYHGGTGDVIDLQSGVTYAYRTAHPATLDLFGAGCAGTVGTPALASKEGQLPWIGAPFTFEVSGTPNGATCMLLFGTPRTFSAPLPRQLTLLGPPLSLNVYGMPTCTLLVRPDHTFPMSITGPGRSEFTVFTPLSLASEFAGYEFHAQVLVFDPGANQGGRVYSNAMSGVLGVR